MNDEDSFIMGGIGIGGYAPILTPWSFAPEATMIPLELHKKLKAAHTMDRVSSGGTCCYNGNVANSKLSVRNHDQTSLPVCVFTWD
jgi:hypothetical protein